MYDWNTAMRKKSLIKCFLQLTPMCSFLTLIRQTWFTRTHLWYIQKNIHTRLANGNEEEKSLIKCLLQRTPKCSNPNPTDLVHRLTAMVYTNTFTYAIGKQQWGRKITDKMPLATDTKVLLSNPNPTDLVHRQWSSYGRYKHIYTRDWQTTMRKKKHR